MPEKAVTNAGPIIHLFEISQLGLLHVFEQVFVPQKIVEETSNIVLPVKNYKVVTLHEEDIAETRELLKEFKLHPGEMHSLHLAKRLNVLFLTDDLEARNASIFLNIEVHGTAGIIVLGYQRGLLSKEQAKEAIQQLYFNSSLFLTHFIVEEALQLLK